MVDALYAERHAADIADFLRGKLSRLRYDSTKDGATYGKSHGYQIKLDRAEIFVKMAPYIFLSFDRWKPPSMSTVEIEITMLCAIKRAIIDAGLSPHFCEIFAFSRHRGIAAHIGNMPLCARAIRDASLRTEPEASACDMYDMNLGGQSDDRFAIIITEDCGMPITKYMHTYASPSRVERDRDFTAWMFQGYFSILVARRTWSSFRHGDLSIANLLISNPAAFAPYRRDLRYLQYVVDNHTYNVPTYGDILKIIDFGHGTLTEEGAISPIAMPGDVWVDDHIMFIAAMNTLMLTFAEMPGQEVMSKINPSRLTTAHTRNAVMQYAKYTLDPEQAFAENVFSMFAVEVAQDKIIKKYTAPAKRKTK
jgi:hypothetical protein